MSDWQHASRLASLSDAVQPDDLAVARAVARARRVERRPTRWPALTVGALGAALVPLVAAMVALSDPATSLVEPGFTELVPADFEMSDLALYRVCLPTEAELYLELAECLIEEGLEHL